MVLINFVFIVVFLSVCVFLFSPCLAPLREELFLAVHSGTERKQEGGYAESSLAG